MKKTALGLTVILALSLTFVFASLPQIGLVKAESIIYIREDGSVEGTDKIQRDNSLPSLLSGCSLHSALTKLRHFFIETHLGLFVK